MLLGRGPNISIATDSSGPLDENNVRRFAFLQGRTCFSRWGSIRERCGRLLPLVVASKRLWLLCDGKVSDLGYRPGASSSGAREHVHAESLEAKLAHGLAGAGGRGKSLHLNLKNSLFGSRSDARIVDRSLLAPAPRGSRRVLVLLKLVLVLRFRFLLHRV